jgi:hypothetical protein
MATENGNKAGVRRGRRGGEAGTGSVKVSGKGVKAVILLPLLTHQSDNTMVDGRRE